MGNSRQTSGPGAAAARWLIVLTDAELIERAVSCWHLHQLISQNTQSLESWLLDSLHSELKLKLLEVEGGTSPIASDASAKSYARSFMEAVESCCRCCVRLGHVQWRYVPSRCISRCMFLPRASNSLEYFLWTKTMFLASSRYHMFVFSFISTHSLSVLMLPLASFICDNQRPPRIVYFWRLLERFLRRMLCLRINQQYRSSKGWLR